MSNCDFVKYLTSFLKVKFLNRKLKRTDKHATANSMIEVFFFYVQVDHLDDRFSQLVPSGREASAAACSPTLILFLYNVRKYLEAGHLVDS